MGNAKDFIKLQQFKIKLIRDAYEVSDIEYNEDSNSHSFTVKGNKDALMVFIYNDELSFVSDATGMDFKIESYEKFIESLNHKPFKGV